MSLFGPTHSREYRDYLGSERWQIVRTHAIRCAGYRCEHCGRTRQQAGWLEVNHKHYRTPFGQEQWPRDIEALCHSCHQRADDARRRQNDPHYWRKRIIGSCALWLFVVFDVVILLKAADLIAGGQFSMDPIFGLFTSISDQIRTQGFLPIFGLAAAIIALMFVWGNREHAMSRAQWALIGAAVLLGFPRILAWLQGAIK